MNNSKQKRNISITLLIIIISIAGFFTIKDKTLYVDETVHHKVIDNFCNLNLSIHPNLTNIPAYHAILGGICNLVSNIYPINSIHFTRQTSLILSLAGLYILFLIAKKLKHKTPIITTLQLLLLPIAFPFYFLVYTDIPSIAPIALAILLALNKQYGWSGILITLSIAFRQNNIIWLGWLAILILLENLPSQYNLKNILKYTMRYLSKIWTYILGTLTFGLFIKLNSGISLAKAEEWAHPSFSIHLGNIYLMLILFTLIFLPLVITKFSKTNKLYKNKKLLASFLLTFIFIAYTFLFKFENTHPYNQHEFAIHNKILVVATSSLKLRLITLIPIFLALLTIFSTKLRKPLYYSIYLFSILFVIPSWLIEPRYYIIPYYLYILFKKENSHKTNIALITWQLILSGVLLTGMLQKLFLP